MPEKKILIVEDEVLVARDLELRMNKAGYCVTAVVADAESAFVSIMQEKPDIIIMDVMLKGRIDGIEAAAIVRRQYSLPVVFITAYEDDATVSRAKKAAPYGYLTKPVNTRSIEITLEMALARYSLEKQLKAVNEELEGRVMYRTSELTELNKRLICEIKKHQRTENELFSVHRELIKKEREIRKFSRRLIQVREQEQKRLANDLHDESGALIMAVSSKLSVVEAEMRDGNYDKAAMDLKSTKQILREEVLKLKRIATELRPPELEMIGLKDALQHYLIKTSEASGVEIDYAIALEDEDIVDDETAIVIYRVVQESLTNMMKYASCMKAELVLLIKDSNVILNFRDEGVGFDLARLSERSDKICIGITGMRERVESVDGIFDIYSKPGEGTSISAMIPLSGKVKEGSDGDKSGNS